MTFAEHSKLWRENRLALIAARRRGDDEAAKRHSQEREKLKQKRFCLDCGIPLNASSNGGERSRRCRMHHTIHRFYSRSLA